MQVWVDAACKTKSFLCFWTIQHKWGWTGTAWEEGPSSCCLQHLPVPRHWEPLWPLDQGISLFQNSGKKLHLTTALTNCSARRETLPHCSLARSTCWQHSSVTSQGTGTGKPTNSSCSLYFPRWSFTYLKNGGLWLLCNLLSTIHLRLALPAVSSSRVVFEKSVLESSTQHTNGCRVIITFPFPILRSGIQ